MKDLIIKTKYVDLSLSQLFVLDEVVLTLSNKKFYIISILTKSQVEELRDWIDKFLKKCEEIK